jgi:hypothetical protein
MGSVGIGSGTPHRCIKVSFLEIHETSHRTMMLQCKIESFRQDDRGAEYLRQTVDGTTMGVDRPA